MPSINITTNESFSGSTGLSTGTGAAFIAGVADSGPSTYTQVQSLAQYVSIYGARSTTSAILYDTLDEFFSDGGVTTYVCRVTDDTAATASVILQDASSHPTVNVAAKYPGIGGNSLAVTVTVNGGDFTISVLQNGGVVEVDGPFSATSALFEVNSSYVVFSQSSGSGFTTANPAAIANDSLTGGANATDLTDSSYVSTLANFPEALGAGSVALPGQTDATVWEGLLAHAEANNRFAVLDMADSMDAAAVAAAAAELSSTNDAYGIFIQGSLILPGISPSTTRTVPGSAGVLALRGRVGQTDDQNVAPCGPSYQLTRPVGFTTYYGATPSVIPGGSGFSAADVQTLELAGVNVWSNSPVPCLWGFVTPVSRYVDAIFWQATATVERMALVADFNAVLTAYLFKTIDGAGTLLTALGGDLNTVISNHWSVGALYGATASDAGTVAVLSPVNTAATAQAGQLNAQVTVLISPYADAVDLTLSVANLTQVLA